MNNYELIKPSALKANEDLKTLLRDELKNKNETKANDQIINELLNNNNNINSYFDSNANEKNKFKN
ncbi:hypothetical protein [[Mycoplasma] anseris]|uniref:Uncharacterized protein n=1 Tax=[Mycoplasma] anseris TaxID=92400 RepID=A0A2Z4NDM9_9BACT|nr:hypothetical protein [[Mycoplasma] anseris]AWX69649.1 hypothetical protein DP065_02755 [[Mycoplasma] anseris]